MTYDNEAIEQRLLQMRLNAGDWLLKNKNALLLCQSVLIEKTEVAKEGLEDPHSDLCGFLMEIEDAVDLLASVGRDLRNADFWPATAEANEGAAPTTPAE